MKFFSIFFLFLMSWCSAQNIKSVQLFNPQTNDETPVIGLGEQLVLRFDDLKNSSTIYRYTIKHYDRNWEDDGLFFTEFAEGSLNGLINNFQYSFNTLQKYTHYELVFPNEKMRPKISGNFSIIVYENSVDDPIFEKRFCVVEGGASLALNITRYSDARNPEINQRVEVQAVAQGQNINANANTTSLNILQNNNWNKGLYHKKPTAILGNQMLFQQLDLSFPGNNEFYYFDNKNMNRPFDMVAGGEIIDGENHTYLHPVWAFPLNYQYQPDVNGAYYFRRNDLGQERNADTEADYSWVYFILESEPVEQNIYVLGKFNEYIPSPENQMQYDQENARYVAKIFLKQGWYNYLIATERSPGELNFGEVNGNFWQTENLYQAFLYYRPFGRNYDGLLGYGEFRTPIQ